MGKDALGMRWIDFSHKITLRTMILEKSKIFIFSLQYKALIFLNQGSIFKLRECAESIFRLEITLKTRLIEENQKKIFALKRSSTLIFRVKLNFSCFQMRAIDFSPRNYPKKLVFRRKPEKNFRVKTQFYPDFQGHT